MRRKAWMLGTSPSMTERRGNRDASFLLPDGRRWRGAPDEGLPFPQKAAAAPLHLNDQRRALTPAPLPSGRGVPACCPERMVPRSLPGAERNPRPQAPTRPWHTSGRPSRMGDGRGDCTGGFAGGDKLVRTSKSDHEECE